MSAILGGFSINTAGGSRRLAQRDCEFYWRRLLGAGGSDINASGEIVRIEQWLRGLYDLLGHASVGAWLFRSAQSMGTGSVAPGLGGLARDAILQNGAPWSAGGITNSAGFARHMLVPGFPLIAGDFASGADITFTTLVNFNAQRPVHFSSDGNNGRHSTVLFAVGTTAGNFATIAAPLTGSPSNRLVQVPGGNTAVTVGAAAWCYGSTRFDLSAFVSGVNSGSSTAVPTNPATVLPFTAANTTNFLSHKQSNSAEQIIRAAWVATRFVSNTEHQAIRALYKTTVGSDLSLP